MYAYMRNTRIDIASTCRRFLSAFGKDLSSETSSTIDLTSGPNFSSISSSVVSVSSTVS